MTWVHFARGAALGVLASATTDHWLTWAVVFAALVIAFNLSDRIAAKP